MNELSGAYLDRFFALDCLGMFDGIAGRITNQWCQHIHVDLHIGDQQSLDDIRSQMSQANNGSVMRRERFQWVQECSQKGARHSRLKRLVAGAEFQANRRNQFRGELAQGPVIFSRVIAQAFGDQTRQDGRHQLVQLQTAN